MLWPIGEWKMVKGGVSAIRARAAKRQRQTVKNSGERWRQEIGGRLCMAGEQESAVA